MKTQQAMPPWHSFPHKGRTLHFSHLKNLGAGAPVPGVIALANTAWTGSGDFWARWPGFFWPRARGLHGGGSPIYPCLTEEFYFQGHCGPTAATAAGVPSPLAAPLGE